MWRLDGHRRGRAKESDAVMAGARGMKQLHALDDVEAARLKSVLEGVSATFEHAWMKAVRRADVQVDQ